MKYDLTQDQLEKLNKAIDLAEMPGACQYVVDDKPCCVIAQLAVLEGISLNRFDESENETVRSLIEKERLPELKSYNKDFLYLLQRRWDLSKSLTIENARVCLRSTLDISAEDIPAKLRELIPTF